MKKFTPPRLAGITMADADTAILTQTISALICVDAERRGVEANARALADFHETLRSLSPEAGSRLRFTLRAALNIVGDPM